MADISQGQAVQMAESIVGREKANGILVSQWLEYAQSIFKLGRNAGLDEAKQLFPQPHQEYFGREAQDAIESLKDNTP